MKTSLLTRVTAAFCLVVLAAASLLWAYIAMQGKIMERYDATQATDISSLRDIQEAQRSVIDYRNILLAEAIDELTRSLRLAQSLAPAEEKIHGLLRNIALREQHSSPLHERSAFDALLTARMESTQNALEQLPLQISEVLRALDSPTTNEGLETQQALSRALLALDTLDEQLRHLAHVFHQRYAASTEILVRDQERADHLTVALMFAMVLAFLVATTTVWRALRPIQRLTLATSKVAAGNFRLEPVQAGNDEVGQLASAFNQMTLALAERDDALQHARLNLETAYQNLIKEEQARIRAERLAVIGELSARITHELRNPLSSLNLNVEMILEDPKLDELDEETVEMLHAVEREIQRLEQLSSGYLTLVRGPASEHRPLDLCGIVRAVIEQFRRSVAQDEVQLTADLPDTCDVDGDENELRQVLINLIENARIALEHRDAPRHIHIVLRVDDETAVLRVEDNGQGVDPAMLETLFEPFATDRQEGTGLGLSTSRRIAHAHEGTLRYEARGGGGAVFSLQLPILRQK